MKLCKRIQRKAAALWQHLKYGNAAAVSLPPRRLITPRNPRHQVYCERDL